MAPRKPFLRLAQATFSLVGGPKGGNKQVVSAFDNPIYADNDGAGTGPSPSGRRNASVIMVRPEEEARWWQQEGRAEAGDGSDAKDLTEAMFPDSKKLFRRMRYQFWAVVVLIVAHILVMAYTDPLFTSTPLTQVIVFSAQLGLLVAIAMAFFLLTSQTLYIQLGRYDLYLREFALLYVTFTVELLVFIALKAYQTVLLYQYVNHLALWLEPGYRAVWIVQRITLLLFWVAASYSALNVFDARLFDPEVLVGLVEGRDRTAGERQQSDGGGGGEAAAAGRGGGGGGGQGSRGAPASAGQRGGG